MDDRKMIEEAEKRQVSLCKSIVTYIDRIVIARLEGDVSAEIKAWLRVEGLINGTLQDLMIKHGLLDVHQETSKSEDPILADAKGQATEVAILTACSEFKRFCDTMIDCSANSDKSVPEVFKDKEYWAKDFERELRNKLQAHQPMQGSMQTK